MNAATLSALRASVEARAAAIRSDASAVRALSAPVVAALADLRAAIAEQKDALARMEAEAGAALAGMLPALPPTPTASPERDQADAMASSVEAFNRTLAEMPAAVPHGQTIPAGIHHDHEPRGTLTVDILPAHRLNGGAALAGMNAGQSELPPSPIPPKRGRAAGHLNGRK